MQKRTRSLLAELDSIPTNRDKQHFVESRATNLIQSAINLMSFIKENYDVETATELERRLFNSIKSGDSSKFVRGIRKIKNEN
ncbi:hypothetical protein UFOVP1636_305 [uncultured Caudovirales phage]|uniref:Uncharacterized protein n=1 Tax=uncultured Caudovirales phage TaxID=2100421 RepID=A0A6J5T164_9CAUD|nr:hypothetical protein UFOVP1636_305 [uncultured Caudovirales phage]